MTQDCKSNAMVQKRALFVKKLYIINYINDIFDVYSLFYTELLRQNVLHAANNCQLSKDATSGEVLKKTAAAQSDKEI
jgi:hypothetical protein